MRRHRKLSDGKFGRALDDRFEENIEVSLEAGADINARSYFVSSPTPGNVTVLRAARDIDLDDSSVRHGAVEGEELEGEWDASSKHAEQATYKADFQEFPSQRDEMQHVIWQESIKSRIWSWTARPPLYAFFEVAVPVVKPSIPSQHMQALDDLLTSGD